MVTMMVARMDRTRLRDDTLGMPNRIKRGTAGVKREDEQGAVRGYHEEANMVDYSASREQP